MNALELFLSHRSKIMHVKIFPLAINNLLQPFSSKNVLVNFDEKQPHKLHCINSFMTEVPVI